jgi:hypothetical protein
MFESALGASLVGLDLRRRYRAPLCRVRAPQMLCLWTTSRGARALLVLSVCIISFVELLMFIFGIFGGMCDVNSCNVFLLLFMVLWVPISATRCRRAVLTLWHACLFPGLRFFPLIFFLPGGLHCFFLLEIRLTINVYMSYLEHKPVVPVFVPSTRLRVRGEQNTADDRTSCAVGAPRPRSLAAARPPTIHYRPILSHPLASTDDDNLSRLCQQSPRHGG